MKLNLKKKICLSFFLLQIIFFIIRDIIRLFDQKRSENNTLINNDFKFIQSTKINILYCLILSIIMYILYDYASINNYLNNNVVHKIDILTDPF